MSTPVICWICAVVVLLLTEAATAGLVSIWFVGGAIGALIAAILDAGLLVQLSVFVVVSGALLALLRPLAVRMFKPQTRIRTNADRLLGRNALVTGAIDNLHATGTVKIDGVIWSARSLDGSPIPADTLVRIDHIDGVKVIVAPAEVPVS